MKNNKHTPGPWYSSEFGVKTMHGSYVLADWSHEQNKHLMPNAEIEANARLMAAAPEMLEALESLLKLADVVMKRDGSVTDSIRDSAKSVIAKARGES